MLPYGTDVTSLVAVFTTTGSVVQAAGASQISGTTPNDFTNPVVYTVYAADGTNTTYTVTISFETHIFLHSDAGDFIGQGKDYDYLPSNAQISVNATGGLLTVSILGDERWWSNFTVPDNMSQLQTGTYAGLKRYPFHDPAQGGLSWSGEGRGCNVLSGWFAIDKVTYENGILKAIALRFEQHCEGGTPALHGRIHWTSDDKTVPRGPVYPLPAGLWQPATGSTPVAGNYIYLQSDLQDYIGQGQTYIYTPNDAQITVDSTDGHLSVSVNGADWWYGDFQTMSSLNRFQAGYYGSLMRYPVHNPTRGGLSWLGEGRACNRLSGWFAVDDVVYNNGILQTIDLRFEQHCNGLAPALHGKIHWAP